MTDNSESELSWVFGLSHVANAIGLRLPLTSVGYTGQGEFVFPMPCELALRASGGRVGHRTGKIRYELERFAASR